MQDRDKFLKAITEGVVTVEFRKLGTNELRVMPCTLNEELSGGNVKIDVEQSAESKHYAVWCMDKEAWRSFRCTTVENWYEGYPVADDSNEELEGGAYMKDDKGRWQPADVKDLPNNRRRRVA